jgi:GxxExxY protein
MKNFYKFAPLSEKEENAATNIVHSAFDVHKSLGPGLLESVYETCFCHELGKRGVEFKKQVTIPIRYDNLYFESALRLDVLVEGCVICELKSLEIILPVHSAQVLSYLRMSQMRLGFLINFNVPMIRQGIKRIIL